MGHHERDLLHDRIVRGTMDDRDVGRCLEILLLHRRPDRHDRIEIHRAQRGDDPAKQGRLILKTGAERNQNTRTYGTGGPRRGPGMGPGRQIQQRPDIS